MDIEKLKAQVKEIGGIANSVPEPFREKCFELLLSQLIKEAAPRVGERGAGAAAGGDAGDSPTDEVESGSGTIPMTTTLRLFTKKTGVSVDELEKVLMFDEGEVHFIREPDSGAVSKGQIEWALLLALKNGIENDRLAADPEAVRSIVQEKGYYDKGNFASNFKKPGYAKLFKKALAPQGEAEPLTGDGQEALAKLIKRMAGTAT